MAIDGNGGEDSGLDDPLIRQLMMKRSRLRWRLSSVLIVAYLGYGFAGLYGPNVMALPAFGSSMPWVMFLGFSIIVLSIVLSVIYERIVGKLSTEIQESADRRQ